VSDCCFNGSFWNGGGGDFCLVVVSGMGEGVIVV
jgi:hypothetical protein